MKFYLQQKWMKQFPTIGSNPIPLEYCLKKEIKQWLKEYNIPLNIVEELMTANFKRFDAIRKNVAKELYVNLRDPYTTRGIHYVYYIEIEDKGIAMLFKLTFT